MIPRGIGTKPHIMVVYTAVKKALYLAARWDHNLRHEKKGASRDTMETPTYVTELVGYPYRRRKRDFVSGAVYNFDSRPPPPLE